MGREIKRVALDFHWPLNKVWEGFKNPFYQFIHKCENCDGDGYNPETSKIAEEWYDSNGCGRRWGYHYNVGRDGKPAVRPPWKIWGNCRAWVHSLTQDEVDALIAEGRLHDFTHDWTSEKGWQPKDPMPVVTPEMVNEWSQHGLGHDGINRCICVKQRATRLGVYGHCETCKGEGQVWESPEYKQKSEEWVETQPPAGEGWQVWETVSEGSPVTPVFATSQELIDYLVDTGTSREAAEKFVESGWVPSAVFVTNKDGSKEVLKGIESAVLK